MKIRPNLKVVDLGCGTGELTRKLADNLPGSEALGLDYSTDILSKSATFVRSWLYFEQGDTRALKSG
ncbi:methyltransferase domain-containing protein [Meiothermus sp. CFH 77666]|nr:methyltransferase domain-containing protein [Meiothermus sp. CFH 77666]